MNDPQQLIDDYLHNTLNDAGQGELRAWLKEDDSHMQRFTEALMFDEEIRAAVQAKEGANSADRFSGSVTSIPQHPPSAIPFKSTPKNSHRLARAAAWLGAFTWLGNKAQAAGAVSTTTTTLLMTKTTTTAITAAILLAGGGSLYLIHQSNEQAAARVELLQTLPEASDDATAGRKTSHSAAVTRRSRSTTTSTAESTAETNTEFLNKLSGHLESSRHSVIKEDFLEFIERTKSIDVQRLKELLIEAEHMNHPDPQVMGFILNFLTDKSPADATQLGIKHLTSAAGFNEEVSKSVGFAFQRWMSSDPAAAEKWYLAAMASGELIPKSIPKAGNEEYLPERFLSRSRFSFLLKTDSEQALAMVKSMVPADAAHEATRNGKPELIARIAPQLPPEQQYDAAKYHTRELAQQNFKHAAEWVNSLEIADSARGNLLAHAAEAAFRKGEFSRSEALEIINGLPKTPQQEEAQRVIEGK